MSAVIASNHLHTPSAEAALHFAICRNHWSISCISTPVTIIAEAIKKRLSLHDCKHCCTYPFLFTSTLILASAAWNVSSRLPSFWLLVTVSVSLLLHHRMGFRQRSVKQESRDHDGSLDNSPPLDVIENPFVRTGKLCKKLQEEVKQEARLLEYHSLPEYLKDNEYILSNYRADLTFSQAFRSLFEVHNETVNIWTHLLGFLFFLILTIFTVIELWQLQNSPARCQHDLTQGNDSYKPYLAVVMKEQITKMIDPVLKRTTRWPFFVFMGGSMFCLLASTICHLFTCHSKPLAIFLMRVDYVGIAIMIATSFFPPIYYVFQCAPIWQWVYLGTISTMAVITVSVLFALVCQSAKYRPFRAYLFLSMGVAGIIPAIHAVVTNWHEPMCAITLAHEVMMAGFYALGTMLYVGRIPERWKPGMFDLGGHSHNLFHVFVIAGAYTHYRAALLFLEWRDASGCVR